MTKNAPNIINKRFKTSKIDVGGVSLKNQSKKLKKHPNQKPKAKTTFNFRNLHLTSIKLTLKSKTR